MRTELVGVTIGVGPEHARLATLAADRMRRFAGLPVAILNEEDFRRTGLRDPNHLKFRLFDLVEAENILYFDADAFCLQPWEPRVFLGGPEWIAVRGFWFDKQVQQLGAVYGFGADTFNGGFFLANRRQHRQVLLLAETLQRPDSTFLGLKNPDEIALSTALKLLAVPVRFLDRRFNWIQYGRGQLAHTAGVIIGHACDARLRERYLRGDCPDPMSGRSAGKIPAELAGKIFVYDHVGHYRQPLSFRADGTLGGGRDTERYYFLAGKAGNEELVLGSVWDESCRLRRQDDGVWRGRGQDEEWQQVTLRRHRAQVLLDLLEARGRSGQLLQGAEVGVWEGESSAILLQGLPGLHLYLVDAWQVKLAAEGARISTQEEFDRAMIRAEEATRFAAARRTLIPCPEQQAAAFLPDKLDLVFLDADHSYETTRTAIKTWWPKVAPGGLLAGYNYGNPKLPGVKRAVEEFAGQQELEVRTAEAMVWWFEVKP